MVRLLTPGPTAASCEIHARGGSSVLLESPAWSGDELKPWEVCGSDKCAFPSSIRAAAGGAHPEISCGGLAYVVVGPNRPAGWGLCSLQADFPLPKGSRSLSADGDKRLVKSHVGSTCPVLSLLFLCVFTLCPATFSNG